jgi:hypothetical protein
MGSLGVRVLPSGSAQLYHTRKGVLSNFGGQSIVSAIIQGGEIHCQMKTGRTQIYRINNNETGVVGPIRTF